MARKVLVCDDDPTILRLLQVNLEIEGYDVITATNGEEAFEAALRELPSVILLDIMMPRLNGYQTCERLKATAKTKGIPVVFLSAKAQQSDIDLGKAYGVDAYVTKPFNPDELIEVVERLMSPEE